MVQDLRAYISHQQLSEARYEIKRGIGVLSLGRKTVEDSREGFWSPEKPEGGPRRLEIFRRQNSRWEFVVVAISSPTVKGQICIPASEFGTGWKDLANVLSAFDPRGGVKNSRKSRGRLNDDPWSSVNFKPMEKMAYLQAASSWSWLSMSCKVLSSDGGSQDVVVVNPSSCTITPFLRDRCLVGTLEDWTGAVPSAKELERWCNSNWGIGSPVEVKDMNGPVYLIILPSRAKARGIRNGCWNFEGTRLDLIFWEDQCGYFAGVSQQGTATRLAREMMGKESVGGWYSTSTQRDRGAASRSVDQARDLPTTPSGTGLAKKGKRVVDGRDARGAPFRCAIWWREARFIEGIETSIYNRKKRGIKGSKRRDGQWTQPSGRRLKSRALSQAQDVGPNKIQLIKSIEASEGASDPRSFNGFNRIKGHNALKHTLAGLECGDICSEANRSSSGMDGGTSQKSWRNEQVEEDFEESLVELGQGHESLFEMHTEDVNQEEDLAIVSLEYNQIEPIASASPGDEDTRQDEGGDCLSDGGVVLVSLAWAKRKLKGFGKFLGISYGGMEDEVARLFVRIEEGKEQGCRQKQRQERAKES
ncbi:hypothetical protein Acr_07g0014060 [Actinidia rufa]|uniref:DUF4283 domain-containing protein n=1 Tax=Actinidia rufa TaxID=165716 RepID=A0A7J0EXR2_9ERIC|nr:hypothetical protein Acr_07g0014060 [Actinidia rufa]